MAIREDVKLCRDCKWVHVPLSNRIFDTFRPYRFALCESPQIDSVTFRVEGRAHGEYCTVMREFAHRCGRDGKWWEART
jgi:hypothetical protein